VALTALDLLAGVLTARTGAFGGLNTVR
jgi:hypothetical protein